MDKPTLYIKRGCPYCAAAMEYLDEHKIEYVTEEVRSNPEMMEKLQKISGQKKTPTLDWNGEVLADFGVDQLEEFLRSRATA
ncbi:MAG: glutaredoxin family protein [Chthoniobacterales bacterium]